MKLRREPRTLQTTVECPRCHRVFFFLKIVVPQPRGGNNKSFEILRGLELQAYCRDRNLCKEAPGTTHCFLVISY